MDEGKVVHVGVEMDDVEPLVVGSHDRVCDGMIAPDDHRESARLEDLLTSRVMLSKVCLTLV